ncbi:MAG: dehydrogenase [Gammaproteobacteria bacterium]|nr:MAG: dehydrogenase [Gammaproteobacteria bacterium]
MSYMLMIVEPVGQRRAAGETEGQARYARMLEYSAQLKARGLLSASQSLRSEAEGVRVQVRSGKTVRVDGPFAEAKEMVGGYYLLTCKTKDEAIAIAEECPAAQWATVEVREFGPCFT